MCHLCEYTLYKTKIFCEGWGAFEEKKYSLWLDISRIFFQQLSLQTYLRKPLIMRIGYYNLDGTPLIGKIVDINVWDR